MGFFFCFERLGEGWVFETDSIGYDFFVKGFL